jgi:lysophospholipase L1-like esterase
MRSSGRSTDARRRPHGVDHAAVRYLALGDSYTIGEGVTDTDRWPVRLAALVRERGVAVDDPEILACTGWTCGELDAAMVAASLQGPYALISLLIGVNDQYRGASPTVYAHQFSRLLARTAGLAVAAHHVLVLSIPDWGVTPFADGQDRSVISAGVDAFNEINRSATRAAGAQYVDITNLARRGASDQRMLAADGLHPAAPMYDRWARAALQTAEAILGG